VKSCSLDVDGDVMMMMMMTVVDGDLFPSRQCLSLHFSSWLGIVGAARFVNSLGRNMPVAQQPVT
jgi:hypothetical protein